MFQSAGNLRTRHCVPLIGWALACCFSLPARGGTSWDVKFFPFNGANGAVPLGALIIDPRGDLWGTTTNGGANNLGCVFRFDPVSDEITAIASFNGANGGHPQGRLLMDREGNLFGTTISGGQSGMGTLFRITAKTHELVTLASFDGGNGRDPSAGLVFGQDGNLYGTSRRGGPGNGGTVFKFDVSTGVLTVVASFNGTTGRDPTGDLLIDAQGNFYGTTAFGGAHDLGTIFRVDAETMALTSLASFSGADGRYPMAGLVADGALNLYGTTWGGGPGGYGTIFRFSSATQSLTTLASFRRYHLGRYPRCTLLPGRKGVLFGTNTDGGSNGQGCAFVFDSETGEVTRLAKLYGLGSGGDPFAGLISDGNGRFYGTASINGAYDKGAVFRIDVGCVGRESLSAVCKGDRVIARNKNGRPGTSYELCMDGVKCIQQEADRNGRIRYVFKPAAAGRHLVSNTNCDLDAVVDCPE